MMQVASDLEILAYVDEDRQQVWFGTEKAPAENSGLSPEEFAAEEWVLAGREIKLEGTWESTPLIRYLWERKLSTQAPVKIYLGRPMFAENPVDALCRMRQLSDPPSCGGWHVMTAEDYVTYRLIDLLRSRPDPSTDAVMAMFLAAHPAYPALSFLPGMSPWWSAVFIGFVIDPRWWVNPRYPDRLSSYYRMLGIGHPGAAADLWRIYREETEPRLSNPEYGRTSTIFAWTRQGGGKIPEPTCPADFLVRVWRQYSDPAHGLFVAARLFSKFVRDVWLDNLTPPRRYVSGKKGEPRRLQPCRQYSPQLFVPEHFFADKRTLQAWRLHRVLQRKAEPPSAD